MNTNSVGGVFSKARNPEKLYQWYQENLGLTQGQDGSFVVPYGRLAPLLSALADKGVRIEDRLEESEYGRFAWVYDPEGNKIELWEPFPYKDSLINLPEAE